MPKRNVRPFLLMVLVSLSYGCGSSALAPVSDPTDAAQRQRDAPRYHVVQKGETLYSISWRYGQDFRAVARWNGIANPYTIYPGQKLRVRPPAESNPRQRRAAAGSRGQTTSPRSSSPKAEVPRKKAVKRTDSTLKWSWPTQGRVLRDFDANEAGKKGIDISGRPGQPVLAAAPGEVVYSGSGLIRYGKLIIIKHNHTYLSAYAHNRALLVKEGERVRAGQGIAEMGDTGTDRTMLHFEIRRNGKPVNPLRYLPRR
ncbi:MAG: peptidoglycan DD-metalloendopeptidase family protein [Gammaproteobacteria bacterium]|nr:peptidoglycan DD-metalloendopeptidase family protein [Gammaproteobacteria bacterium]NIR32895.1 peptidoglycan DD-metalloendopeptidase family protein [Gammaproteobacteria bacterium]NIR99441.1 peptidoglycan DD-metalloendopeptidase family protein [Gammaproteobacteria bacterium]NIT65055.1 peptidoglycan DD-metalloendopeptidase family protein [Gammaproteobacteria bacterium]NIV21970.1 peptidoglycan DD-metalloendopeptidase family protein [Gammaproteobacteria bacterium]